jgi:hypothetical protein
MKNRIDKKNRKNIYISYNTDRKVHKKKSGPLYFSNGVIESPDFSGESPFQRR